MQISLKMQFTVQAMVALFSAYLDVSKSKHTISCQNCLSLLSLLFQIKHKKMFLHVKSLHKQLNPLTPNDDYSGRTTPLTSKRYILYIYSTNIGTEYFKHGIYSPFFPLQNEVCFINLTYLVPVLFTFYIQSVLKFKK